MAAHEVGDLLAVVAGVQRHDVVLHPRLLPGGPLEHLTAEHWAQVASSHGQDEAEISLLSEPEEDVLETAAGALVSLQEEYFCLLLTFSFTVLLLHKLHHVVLHVGHDGLA